MKLARSSSWYRPYFLFDNMNLQLGEVHRIIFYNKEKNATLFESRFAWLEDKNRKDIVELDFGDIQFRKAIKLNFSKGDIFYMTHRDCGILKFILYIPDTYLKNIDIVRQEKEYDDDVRVYDTFTAELCNVTFTEEINIEWVDKPITVKRKEVFNKLNIEYDYDIKKALYKLALAGVNLQDIVDLTIAKKQFPEVEKISQ